MAESAGVPWRSRTIAALGHHANQMLIGSIVAVVALRLVPLPGLFFYTVPLALFGVVVLSWVLMRQHDRRLCEQCMMSMPLNPSAQAVRYKRRFWMAHTGSEPRFLIPYLVVLISSNFATSAIGRVGWAVIQLTMVYLIMSQSTHRKLQPWCPWCSGNGGGTEVEEPDPVLPQDDRQLV